ncbi:MAG: hypothetical protein WCR31_08890 [Treponema sp.]
MLPGVILSKKGDSPDADQSNFTGMGAAVFASSGGQIKMENVQITSDADGANAVFASGAEIAAVEGKNSITLDNCDLTGAGTHGIMLYQSFSGDAGTGTAVFTARDSKLTSTSDGPFFYITNTTAKAELSGCTLSYPSGTLVQVSGNDGQRGWGRRGSNGGTFLLTAHDQTLSGSVICDSISSMDFVLAANAVYTGTVNGTKSGTVSVTLEKSAVWNVTGDSYLSRLKDTDVSYANIKSNGHTVYYDTGNADNSTFAGKTIVLADGGRLAPFTAEHMTVSVRENDTQRVS